MRRRDYLAEAIELALAEGHPRGPGTVVRLLAAAVLAVGLLILLWVGYRTWYIDTHCTTVLGTQVCTSGSQPAAPQPSPSGPSGVSRGPSGPGWQTWTVSCQQAQCTTLPGAGPHGSTCGPVAGQQQFCELRAGS